MTLGFQIVSETVWKDQLSTKMRQTHLICWKGPPEYKEPAVQHK